MSIEATLAQLLDARLAPLRTVIAELRDEVKVLRQHLPPALVPLNEAAEKFRISEKTAKRWIKSGDLPGKKIGSRYYVDLAALHPPTSDEVERKVRVARPRPPPSR